MTERLAWGLLAAALAQAAAGPAAAAGGAGAEWGPREAEHLFNRAAFGARPDEIARAVEHGREQTVAALIAGAFSDPFFFEPPQRPPRDELAGMDEGQRRRALAELRREQRDLLGAFAGWWVEQMLDGPDPLRERMTLFWHGYFTSSFRDMRDPLAMIGQNEFLRENALARFGDLLRGIVRDPAMLEYLDNDNNRRGNPNENFARELLELFTLGEGHYSEKDVKEAARALTGWVTPPGQDPVLVRRRHDRGPKTILGQTGDFDADGLLEILLAQPACSRWLAGKLLAYLEGRVPGEERLAAYAELLRTSDYRIDRFLEQLFNDPAFYSEELMGQRIAGPIDYLVGTARRLGVQPPGVLVWLAAGQLGERLLDPPNVKGWEGGRSWITTATYLQRGNFAGMMLGVVSIQDVLADDPALSMESTQLEPSIPVGGEVLVGEGMEQEARAQRGSPPGPGTARTGRAARPRALGSEMSRIARLFEGGYRPGIYLSARCQRSGAVTDPQIVEQLADELLAVPLTPQGRSTLLGFLERERSALGAADGRMFDGEHVIEAEKLLRRLAHLVLSLPEAQLN